MQWCHDSIKAIVSVSLGHILAGIVTDLIRLFQPQSFRLHFMDYGGWPRFAIWYGLWRIWYGLWRYGIWRLWWVRRPWGMYGGLGSMYGMGGYYPYSYYGGKKKREAGLEPPPVDEKYNNQEE
uniref:Uncharacterized protein n=1 Tax=Meloidogyne enterolobii TaxID=390850 RepID=A0A6V7V5F3_MELEN|nr:unnamed protein product [Meloidogyne enterolobii]